ncbi:MAG: FecR domain-containing protein [bacterium]|nr:FecR domain-containing protein [bacterium]
MNKRTHQESEKRGLINWKLIRIPRAVFRLVLVALLVVVLLSSLTLAINFGGDRFPWLARLGSVFGITSTGNGDDPVEDTNVIESRFAKLISMKGDVTVKSAEEMRFRKAVKDQVLKEGDTIRTHSGGNAEVLFDDGNRLTVKSDSLVVLRNMKEHRLTKIRKSSIDLLQSDVEATIRRPKVAGSEFEIITPTALAKISDAKVAIQVSKENDSQLKVYRGSVNLQVEDKSLELSEKQAVGISKDKMIDQIRDLPSAPKLTDPENLAEFMFKSLNEMKAVLKWADTAADVKYRLQVALDPFFSDFVIVQTGLSEPGVVVEGLRSGIYYWRTSAVTSEGIEGEFSDYRVFKVTIDQSPPEVKLDDILLVRSGGTNSAQVSGQTELDASIRINGVSVALNKAGRFKYVLSNIESETLLTVVAEDALGNKNVLKRTITVE